MVLGPILGLAGSLAGAGASMFGAGKQADATNFQTLLGFEQLQKQMQLANEQIRMSKAQRTDALGTSTGFRGGQWFTDVTPLTQAILNATQAGERQGLANKRTIGQEGINLTASRGRDTDAGFDADYAEYRYDPDRKSRGALESEYGAIAQRGLEKGQDEVARTAHKTATRLGSNPHAMQAIIKALMENRATNIQDGMIQGKLAGGQAYAQQEQDRGNVLARALQQAGTSRGSFNV